MFLNRLDAKERRIFEGAVGKHGLDSGLDWTLDWTLDCTLDWTFMSVIFSLGGGLRLVALFDSRPSRFT